MAANSYGCEVEFLGGPIDGHTEVMTLPLHTYVGVKVMWCTEHDSFFQSLINRWRSEPPTRIALYQIDQSSQRLCYRYLRTQILSPKEMPWKNVVANVVNENKDAA